MAKVTRGAQGFGDVDRCEFECDSIVKFLKTLSPGVSVVLQYDCQPPAYGCFQGFQDGTIILTNYNGFPGLVRIAIDRVNAVSPFCGGCGGFGGIF
ncbi:MAG: hypothetical protein ACM3ZQ_05595 [Bacillota bacterium]